MTGLASLPDQWLLAAVAEHRLVVPSQLLLAVALNASSSSPPWREVALEPGQLSSATKAVLLMNINLENRHWDRLDFGYTLRIEDSLDEKLTDDVGLCRCNCNILACRKLSGCELKRLGMGCMNITGRGRNLESLRGSTYLEQLDLFNAQVSSEILLPISYGYVIRSLRYTTTYVG